MNKSKRGISPVIIILVILIIAIIVGVVITISNKNNELTLQESNVNKNNMEEQEEAKNESNDFLMTVEDVFSIEGRGTVITGRIERGEVRVGDSVEVVGMGKATIKTEVLTIETFRNDINVAKEGESIGIILEDLTREDVERGHVLVKPGTMNAYTEFEAEISTLSEEKGGKKTSFTNGYKPEFYFRTIGINGLVTLINVEEVKPGDGAKIKVVLTKSVAMEIGTEFSIREGGRTIGKGKITKVY